MSTDFKSFHVLHQFISSWEEVWPGTFPGCAEDLVKETNILLEKPLCSTYDNEEQSKSFIETYDD